MTRVGFKAAAAGIIIVLAGCGSTASQAGRLATAATASHVVAKPLSPLQQCREVVDSWLTESAVAMLHGYPLGVDTTPLMETYGADSAVYQAYMQVFGEMAGNAMESGVSAALGRALDQVPAACQEYGAAGGGDQTTGAGNQPAVAPSPSSAAGTALPAYSPSETPDQYSAGCPDSAQLLAAWNASPASARDSWTTLTPTGFESTECWHQWVVTSPVVNANGLVVFTNSSGRLALLPAAELGEFDAGVCGVAGAPPDWSGPAGPATCS